MSDHKFDRCELIRRLGAVLVALLTIALCILPMDALPL